MAHAHFQSVPLAEAATSASGWNADPVTNKLFASLIALAKIGDSLHRLGATDHAISSVASEVGEVASIYERLPTRDYEYGYRTRANGGACAGLWDVLAARRSAWMAERLSSEGLSDQSAEGFERWMEIDAETLSVADAYHSLGGGL